MTVGLTEIDAVVAAVLHKKDVPPDAVNVDEPPAQIDGLDDAMLHTGPGPTVTVVEQLLVQPPAPVTVTV